MIQDKPERLDFFYSVLNSLPFTGKKRFEDVNVHYKKNFHIGVPNIKSDLTTEYGKYADYSKPPSRQILENTPNDERQYVNKNPQIYNQPIQQHYEQYSPPPRVREQIQNSNNKGGMPYDYSLKNYTKELFNDPFIKNARSNRNIFYTPQPNQIQFSEDRPYTRGIKNNINKIRQIPRMNEYENNQEEDPKLQANNLAFPGIKNPANIDSKREKIEFAQRPEAQQIEPEQLNHDLRKVESKGKKFPPEEEIANYVKMQKAKQRELKLKDQESMNYEKQLKSLSQNDYLKLDWNRYLYRKKLKEAQIKQNDSFTRYLETMHPAVNPGNLMQNSLQYPERNYEDKFGIKSQSIDKPITRFLSPNNDLINEYRNIKPDGLINNDIYKQLPIKSHRFIPSNIQNQMTPEKRFNHYDSLFSSNERNKLKIVDCQKLLKQDSTLLKAGMNMI